MQASDFNINMSTVSDEDKGRYTKCLHVKSKHLKKVWRESQKRPVHQNPFTRKLQVIINIGREKGQQC